MFRLLDDSTLLPHLVRLGILRSASGVGVERVGQGNLNFLRRVCPPGGNSFVVKQVRTTFEAVPGFSLPEDRILFESRYFALIDERIPQRRENIPKLLHYDDSTRLLVMEDIGSEPDLMDRLRAGQPPDSALRDLGAFLGVVHRETSPIASSLMERFGNHSMRNLHGHQLFSLPRHPDLAPETAARIDELISPGVSTSIERLSSDYFQRHDALVHGDVKSANVLLRDDRPCLIDAEFAHIGDPAFDLGTCLAHCAMGLIRETADDERLHAESDLMDGYFSAYGFDPSLRERAFRYAGLDIVYHVVGPARLDFLREPEIATRAIELGIEMLLA